MIKDNVRSTTGGPTLYYGRTDALLREDQLSLFLTFITKSHLRYRQVLAKRMTIAIFAALITLR